jgi:hypothetical protein
MKKFAIACTLSTVVVAGFTSKTNACDRVLYSSSNRVLHTTAVVHATPVVHSTSYATPTRTTTITSTPVVRYTVATTAKVVTPDVVKPAVVHVIEKLPEIAQGSIVHARVRFAGRDAGEVTVVSGGLEMQCEILDWTPTMVTFRMPPIDIVSDVNVSVQVFSGNGKLVKSVKAMLIPPVDFRIETGATTLAHSDTDAAVR